MRIAVWKTGHEIAGTVADSVAFGLQEPIGDTVVAQFDTRKPNWGYPFTWQEVHVAYGILRGTADVFRACDRQEKPWFNIDRGYFSPGHYDGYYRISCGGTQFKWHEGIPERELDFDVKPWRGPDPSKPVLVCPPTQAVSDFFGKEFWVAEDGLRHVWRHKGDPTPINFDDYSHVITFNSSVGWQALQAGIPCISDPHHSAVGSMMPHHYHCQDLTAFLSAQEHNRLKLFRAMRAHQFTLKEIEQGEAWPIINHYLSISGMTDAKQSPQTLQPTQSSAEQGYRSIFARSNTVS